jgi:hypothetical protein
MRADRDAPGLRQRRQVENRVVIVGAQTRRAVLPAALIPTVSLDVMSLVASSCGYYRGQIEHRAAQ